MAHQTVWGRVGFGLEGTLLPKRVCSRLGLIPKKLYFTEGICLCCERRSWPVVGSEQGDAENPLLHLVDFYSRLCLGAVGEHPLPGHQGFSWDVSWSFSS